MCFDCRYDRGSDVEFVFYFGNGEERTKWVEADNMAVVAHTYHQGNGHHLIPPKHPSIFRLGIDSQLSFMSQKTVRNISGLTESWWSPLTSLWFCPQ